MHKDHVLSIATSLPVRHAPPGDIIMSEGDDSPGVFVLKSGTLEVRRGGQLVAVVEEPGSMVGEMAMLLNSPSTADVVARDNVQCHEITDPEAFFTENPQLPLFLARILAQRLNSVTGYLSELKDTYGDTEDHLGLAAGMVERLLASRGLEMPDEPSDEEIAAGELADEQ